MGMPAARVTDMHTCPMVTVLVPHVGGPIIPPCAPTVLIGGLPAARVTDMCICAGPPDMIVKGSMSVFIMGQPAARIGDLTTHGGVIVTGQMNVLIGDLGSGGGAGRGSAGATAVPVPSLSDQGSASDAGTGGPASGAAPSGPKWTKEEIIAEWKKTARGTEILKALPGDTKFVPYKRGPGDNRNAYYSPGENAIYIPEDYTSAEAAPTAAHEAVHADQCMNHGRPKSDLDKLEMEVEAKNAGLDVYEQLGKPTLPYNYEKERAIRAKDQKVYDNLIRDTYRKAYKIK